MNTTHLEPLYAVKAHASMSLLAMLGAHFVSHDTLDRETLVRYAAEAEAIS